jgi:lysine 2,3-aminomutase
VNTEVTARYDYRMTPYMESLLRGRAADDPLSLQFLPDARELLALPHEISDPIGDEAFSPVKGIVHRYPDRVLLKIAHSCPVYCRFCFRREMIGSRGEPLQGHTLDAAIDYLRAHPKIWEVILTGGDPLTLSGRRLGLILDTLASIEHLSVLRVHSRVPIVAPRSIDESMLDALQRSLPVYLAIHVNHPDEITEEVVTAIRRLTDRGVILLSQTVLLKGVNDCVPVLDALFRRLVRLKVRPYYLHHPDLALCMPTYVLDIPGGFGKVPIGPSYVGEKSVSGFRVVQDANGNRHLYPE